MNECPECRKPFTSLIEPKPCPWWKLCEKRTYCPHCKVRLAVDNHQRTPAYWLFFIFAILFSVLHLPLGHMFISLPVMFITGLVGVSIPMPREYFAIHGKKMVPERLND